MKALILVPLLCGCLAYAEPPQEIPPEIVHQATMEERIPVLKWYLNNSYPPSIPIFFSKTAINANIEKIQRREMSYYGSTDLWLYDALQKYPIQGKTVAIIGSTTPWYESIVLAYKGIPTTIEYNKITTDDERLTLLTVEEFDRNPRTFDRILAISSIEHDGLGRYGDPINPDGDLDCMKKLRSMLKKDGYLIVAMPVGADCLVWNAHRIYGPLRLPKLFQEWNVIDSFGFSEAHFCDRLGNCGYQPVFYLSRDNHA